MYGELIPVGGGDPIPLLKQRLLVGRRESCDIVLRFSNVSSQHCEFTLQDGYWYLKDLNSRNGCKVNNVRVSEKRVDPGDTVTIAKHPYEIRYQPEELGAKGPPPNNPLAEVFGKSLLERAGLAKQKATRGLPDDDDEPKRYNVHDNSAGQIKTPRRPL